MNHLEYLAAERCLRALVRTAPKAQQALRPRPGNRILSRMAMLIGLSLLLALRALVAARPALGILAG